MRLIAIDPGSHIGHATFDVGTGELVAAGQWDSIEGSDKEHNRRSRRLGRTELHLQALWDIHGRRGDDSMLGGAIWAMETYPMVAYVAGRTVALAINWAFKLTIEKWILMRGDRLIEIPAPKSRKSSRKFTVEALYPVCKTWKLGEHARDAILVGHKALAQLRTETMVKGLLRPSPFTGKVRVIPMNGKPRKWQRMKRVT